MDFLNQTTAQVRDLFASMTPGARVTAGLLLVVVVVSMGFLFQQATTGPDEYLFGGESIDRGRLPRMEAAMSAAEIDYTTEGTKIRVSRADKNRAIAAIASAGELPPEFHRLMDDAINGGSIFDFRETKMQRMRAAREAQASLILGDFPWVEKANVIYNERQESGLRGLRHASAAVSIMPAAGEQFSSQRMRVVKDFVAKACDVPLEDVSVTSLGVDASMADGSVSADDYDHPLYKLRAKEEQRIRQAILSQLVDIRGVKVQVNARLDETSEQRVVETEPKGEPVALRRSSLTEEDTQNSAAGGDRVGVEANGPNGIGRDDQLARQDQSKKTVDSSDTSSGIGYRTTETVTAGFGLKEAEASVVVPMSYVRDVFRERNRNPDGSPPEQIEPNQLEAMRSEIKGDIENIVKPLLPKLQLGQNEYKQVQVTFFTDLPREPLPTPSIAAGALGWAGRYGNTLAMAGLAVFSLVMLRSMVSSSGKESPVGALPSLQLDGESVDKPRGGDGDDDEPQRPKLRLKKADTLKDDLSEMVNSDPDAAAAILRSWINNAA